MGNRPASVLPGIWILLIIAFLPQAVCAQAKERPKLKDFGSSLKRTRWDPAKRQAIVEKPKSQSAEEGDLDVVKIETSLVTNDVLIVDAAGNAVDGLTEKDFLISEDDAPQTVGIFSLGANSNLPRTIVLVIDYSSSQRPYIETSIAAAKTMIDKLGPLDRIAIVDDDIELLQDFTTDKKKLKDKLESLRKKTESGVLSRGSFGKSKQYSALFATLNEAFNSEDQRPIVVFQTDGDQLGLLQLSPLNDLPRPPGRPTPPGSYKPEYTSFSLEDIYRAAEKARATIYTVVPGYQLFGLSKEEQIKRMNDIRESFLTSLPIRLSKELRERIKSDEYIDYDIRGTVEVQKALASVAIVSGGWLAFLEKPDQANGIYSRIFSDINRRYIIGYYPTNKEHDGKRRKISITVRDHPNYRVIGRKWYYAPSDQ